MTVLWCYCYVFISTRNNKKFLLLFQGSNRERKRERWKNVFHGHGSRLKVYHCFTTKELKEFALFYFYSRSLILLSCFFVWKHQFSFRYGVTFVAKINLLSLFLHYSSLYILVTEWVINEGRWHHIHQLLTRWKHFHYIFIPWKLNDDVNGSEMPVRWIQPSSCKISYNSLLSNVEASN